MHRFVKSCLVAVAAASLGLAGCAGEDEPQVAEIRTVSGFAGIAVADEPRAALVGRDMLGQNANAIDAAVAMTFTMTVTLPSRVGLGGGGACVVHKRGEKTTQALLFLPKRGEQGAAVPVLARGMAALHARYGLQSWSQVVSPAERLARFGYHVSRAFRTDLEKANGEIGPGVRALYLRADGSLPAVGDMIRQPALSATLAGVRGRGAGYLHTGTFARRLAEAAGAAGEPLTPEDLRDATAAFVEPLAVPFEDHRLYLPPPPAMGGLAVAQSWAMAREAPDMDDPASPARAHFLIEAWKRALSERTAWLDAAPGGRPDAQSLVSDETIERLLGGYDGERATPAESLAPAPRAVAEGAPTAGLSVVDRFGNMVACTFTMNGLFGSGHRAGGTGVILAGRRDEAVAGAGLAPAVVANPYTGEAYLAASAAGGSAGQSALVQTLTPLADLDEDVGGASLLSTKSTLLDRDEGEAGNGTARLRALLGLARLHHPGAPDIVGYESGIAPDILDGLRRRGHELREGGGAGAGRVNAIYCPRGPRVAPGQCQQAVDPRGHGLAVRAQ